MGEVDLPVDGLTIIVVAQPTSLRTEEKAPDRAAPFFFGWHFPELGFSRARQEGDARAGESEDAGREQDLGREFAEHGGRKNIEDDEQREQRQQAQRERANQLQDAAQL